MLYEVITISLSSTLTRKSLITNPLLIDLLRIPELARSADAAFETDADEFLRLDGELHRQVLEDFLAEASYNFV